MTARRGPLFTGMFLAAALSPLGSTMIAVALPSIGRELGVPGATLTQWLVASYLIVGAAAMSPCGKLGDIIGHRRALTIGMGVYGTGALVGFGLATLPALAFARIAMAFGGAMVVPATMALLRNVVPAERRPRTFGWYGSIMGTAAAIGPLVGGELTARFGWRAVFIANVPVILLAFALIRMAGGAEPANEKVVSRPRFDVEGSVLLAASLSLLVFASRAKGAPWALIAGVVLLGAFLWHESRAAAPVIDLGLFTRREFTAGNCVVGLQNLAMYALLFQLPIYFEQVRGLHAGTTGRVVIGMMIAMVLFAPLGGRLAERFGARTIAFTGCVVSLAGVWCLADFTKLAAPRDALLGLVLVGVGLGLATSPSQSAAMTAASRDEAGMAGGTLSTSRYLGGVIGITLLSGLLASDPHVAAHSRAAFCYAVALAISALTALMLPGRRVRAVEEPMESAAVG